MSFKFCRFIENKSIYVIHNKYEKGYYLINNMDTSVRIINTLQIEVIWKGMLR